MKQFYFLCALSLLLFPLKAQELENVNIDYCGGFDGAVWYEFEGNNFVLYWDEPRPDEIICYQIIGMNSNGEYVVLARLSGNSTSYTALDRYPDRYMFHREESPFFLLAFYNNGEIMVSNEFQIDNIRESTKIFKNLHYYHINEHTIGLQWEEEGILPIHYCFESSHHGGGHCEPQDIEMYCHSLDIQPENTYFFRLIAYYEDGEELELTCMYDFDLLPRYFAYEIIENEEGGNDNLILTWESRHEELGYDATFRVECNGEAVSENGNTYSEMNINRYEIFTPVINFFSDYERGELYTGKLYEYSLYAIYGDEFILKAENNLWDAITYCLPRNLNYNISHGTINFSWSYDYEGLLPEYYQIAFNGGEIDYISGEETHYSFDLNSEEFGYRMFAVYKDKTILIVGYEGEVSGIHLDLVIAPLAPINFGYTIQNNNNVRLTWSMNPQGLTPSYYSIQRNNATIATLSGSTLHYTDQGLVVGNYTYRLFAHYSTGEVLEAGNTLNVTITKPKIQPTNFAYTLQNENNVKLTWSMSSQGLTPSSYKISRNGTIIATVSGNTLTYTDQELEPGTYTYRLFAHYSAWEVLEAGNQITLTIDPLTYAEPKYLSYDMDNRDVVLFWDIFSGDIEPSSYKIERNGNFIADVSSEISVYYDTTAGLGTHYYRLFAYYGDNTIKIIPEDSLEVIIPEFWEPIITGENIVFSQHIVFNVEPVFQLSHTSGDNSVSLTWEMLEGSNVVDHYKIERNGNSLFQVDGNTLSFIDAGLEFGTYEYTVKAYYTNDSFLNHVARIVGRVVLTLFSCE